MSIKKTLQLHICAETLLQFPFQPAECVCVFVYLTSLQPICWRSSCLSVSELRGRMFFSSSSLLLGRFPSLMLSVSRRRIFMAKEPGGGGQCKLQLLSHNIRSKN